MSRRMLIRIIIGLVVAHAAQVAWVASHDSHAVDEPAHLAAGVYVWKLGRFDLYEVNPPLVRTLAAIPVVLSGAEIDWTRYRHGLNVRTEWMVGLDFIKANRTQWRWFLTLARWVCVPLSLLGGYVCYLWARDLYGMRAGLLALTLWCFSPNMVAYAAHLTPDATATSLGVLAGYCFWRWLRVPTGARALASGMTLALAALTKTTWILLFGLWPILWLVWTNLRMERARSEERRRQGWQLASMLLIGVYLLNLGYGFEGSFRRLGSYTFASRTLAGADAIAEGRFGGNRFADHWLGMLPVPLPESFLAGMDLQKVDFEMGGWSYLRGTWKKGGWWYYYLYALLVKVPLGTWVFAVLALGTTLAARDSGTWRDDLVLVAPALAVLALVSSQTGFNHHPRYALPVLPFVFIAVARVATRFSIHERALFSASAAAALLWSITSSLSVFPHSVSYFNELAGGPMSGHEHLLHSGIDWGQDRYYLEQWLEENPQARPIRYDLFGIFDLPQPGVEHVSPESVGPRPGWLAVSVHRLHDRYGQYDYLHHLEPTARAGFSIYIYHITPEQADHVRRELGLPELDESAGELTVREK